MHIADGVLPAGITIGAHIISGATLALTSRDVEKHEIPKISLFTAVFFVASLIHIPIPPTSIHLVLSGLIGIILGKRCFIAIWIGLFFQTIMFQHGGLLSLGINSLNMGIPALIISFAYSKTGRRFNNEILSEATAAILSALAIILSSLLIAFELYLTEESFLTIITFFFTGALITALIEGIITFSVVRILKKVKPDLMQNKKSQEKMS